jgi:hypothetical protein
MTRWEGDDIRIELPRVVEAHVRITGGDLAVTAANGPARLHVDVASGDPAVVTVEDGVLIVRHEPQTWVGGMGTKRAECVVTLTVPPETPVVLGTVSADLVVAGIQAGVSATTVSGAITATDVAGPMNFKSVSGDVEVQPVDGEMVLNTISGNATVSGRVSTVTGRAVSGDLTFDLEHEARASITTVSGEVLMRVPASANLRLDLTTMSGKLDSAFPITGTSGKRHLAGIVGSHADAPSVEVRTMSGDVALLRKELVSAAAIGESSLDDR